MTQATQKATAAYEHAQAVDTIDAWRTAATLLFKAMPKPKVSRRKGKCRYPYPIAVAVFDDGTVTRKAFFSPEGKPIDWGRAAKQSEHAYRFEKAVRPQFENVSGPLAGIKTHGKNRAIGYLDKLRRTVSVPPIVRLYDEATGEELQIEKVRKAA